MRLHPGGPLEAGALENGRPEQAVEINDVLADEMVHLGIRAGAYPGVEIKPALFANLAEAGQIADGRVQPDVEELVLGARDAKAEIRFVARDVPVAEAFFEPLFELVGDLGLQRAGTQPFLQARFEGL